MVLWVERLQEEKHVNVPKMESDNYRLETKSYINHQSIINNVFRCRKNRVFDF